MTDMYRTAAAIAAKYENKDVEFNGWPKYGDLVEFNDRFNGRVYQGIFIEYAHEYGPTYQHNRRAMLFYADTLHVKDVLTFTPEEYLGVIVSRNDWIEQMCTKKNNGRNVRFNSPSWH